MTAFHDRGGTVLFVNAGDYDNTFVFERLFAAAYLVPGSVWWKRHPRHVLAGANHIYGMPEWRAEILSLAESFLASELTGDRFDGGS